MKLQLMFGELFGRLEELEGYLLRYELKATTNWFQNGNEKLNFKVTKFKFNSVKYACAMARMEASGWRLQYGHFLFGRVNVRTLL